MYTFLFQELPGFAGQVHFLHLVETKLDDATILFVQGRDDDIYAALACTSVVWTSGFLRRPLVKSRCLPSTQFLVLM
jgi:hypothetical protein